MAPLTGQKPSRAGGRIQNPVSPFPGPQPALLLPSCVIWDNLFNLYLFPYSYNEEDHESIYLLGLLWEISSYMSSSYKCYFGLVAIPVSRTLAKSEGHSVWSLRKPLSSPQITCGLWAWRLKFHCRPFILGCIHSFDHLTLSRISQSNFHVQPWHTSWQQGLPWRVLF